MRIARRLKYRGSTRHLIYLAEVHGHISFFLPIQFQCALVIAIQKLKFDLIKFLCSEENRTPAADNSLVSTEFKRESDRNECVLCIDG